MKRGKAKEKNRRLKKQRNTLIKSVKKDVLALKNDTMYQVLKRGDYSFLKELINMRINFRTRFRKDEPVGFYVPKDLDKLIEIDSRIYMNKKAMNSIPKYFKGDIIITDPCYIPDEVDMDKVNYIARDTLYGDWSCTTYNPHTKEILGHFCADSGMVAVISLDDILKQMPDFNDYKKEYAYTVIRNFDGYIRFVVKETFFEYEGKKCKDYNVHVVGKGNIDFYTSQTGL